jgi:hypothetical protein
MAYDLYLLRVDAILLGRLGLKPSEAIDAYRKLEPALSVGPAKDDKERKRNSEAFEAAFREVLSDAGFEADTPMITTGTTKARTSVLLLTWNSMLIDSSEWFVPRTPRISLFYIPFAPTKFAEHLGLPAQSCKLHVRVSHLQTNSCP